MFQSSSPVAGGCDRSASTSWPPDPNGFQSSSPVAGGCDKIDPHLTHFNTRFNPHPPLPGDATLPRPISHFTRIEFQSSSPVAGGCDGLCVDPGGSFYGFQSSSPVAGGCDRVGGVRRRPRPRSFNPHPPLPGDATGPRTSAPASRGVFQSSSPVAGGCDGSSNGRTTGFDSVFQSSSPVAGGCDVPRLRFAHERRAGFNPHPPLPGDATLSCGCP